MSAGMRVCLLGATGTIGRAVRLALVARGHEVVCLLRRTPGRAGPTEATTRVLDVADPGALARDGFRGERFDAVISCMASRTGAPADAWAVDYRANLAVLEAARAAGVERFILLSAICVQKPLLAFQHAKLAFESALIGSGLTYSIVRPTAFFKSLSGQIERVRAGGAFLVFGDGALTACKPISDNDLAAFIADCLDHPAYQNRILPIGGPGPAISPRDQAEFLFDLLGRTPRIRHIPPRLLDGIIGGLALAGRLNRAAAAKAELARIGRYYATESMLVLDPATGRYDAAATPATGTETLFDFYRSVIEGRATAPGRGDHAVF